MGATTRQPYPSDLSDAEWQQLAPLVSQAGPGGRRRKHDMREILNGIFYVLRTGCFWHELPSDMPPWRTVYSYFRRWQLDGTWPRLLDGDGQSALRAAMSNRQYRLNENDGSTWVPLDPINLSLTIDSPIRAQALLSGHANLVALHLNLNVQLGICAHGGCYGNGTIMAWQQAGGSVISAVFLQAVIALVAHTSYHIELVWKSDRPMFSTETIVAGISCRSSPAYSSSGLTALLVPVDVEYRRR